MASPSSASLASWENIHRRFGSATTPSTAGYSHFACSCHHATVRQPSCPLCNTKNPRHTCAKRLTREVPQAYAALCASRASAVLDAARIQPFRSRRTRPNGDTEREFSAGWFACLSFGDNRTRRKKQQGCPSKPKRSRTSHFRPGSRRADGELDFTASLDGAWRTTGEI